MRKILLALQVLTFPILACSPIKPQEFTPAREPLLVARPALFMTFSSAPMMLIDERELEAQLYQTLPFPAKAWNEAVRCVATVAEARGLKLKLPIGDPPPMLIVPVARTIRVVDMTLDSLLYAEDSVRVESHYLSPTIAYALVHTNAVLVVERYQANIPVLRHEAIHFIIWRSLQMYGHPDEFFYPCDKAYTET